MDGGTRREWSLNSLRRALTSAKAFHKGLGWTGKPTTKGGALYHLDEKAVSWHEVSKYDASVADFSPL